jgi:hypothetical protein
MLGLSFLQALFMCFGTILLIVGEVTTPHVLMCVGCYVVAVLLQIVIELKDFNKKVDKFLEKSNKNFGD